ncbi:MAG: hypothetical protein ACXW27_06830 [Allosphingosinicella sp.]
MSCPESREIDPMQIVFVHGVAVRREPDPALYERGVADRQRSFREYCLEGTAATFFDPYWGGFGAHADSGFASIPRGPGVALGLGGGLGGLGGGGGGGGAGPQASLEGDTLLTAARADFGAMLNTLSLALTTDGDPRAQAMAGALGDYAAMLDPATGEASVSRPAWVDDPALRRDRDFLDRLQVEIAAPAPGRTTLGLGNLLERAGRRIVDSAIGLVDGPAQKLVRWLTPQIAHFLGDVFIYLNEGPRRERIREVIVDDLVAAARNARERGEKLVVIGHSMGGIILYDLLNDAPAVARIEDAIGGPLAIDLLLTVGTQIGLFEELDLFVASRPGVAGPRPPAARRWWHVYNVMDVLSFAVEDIVEGAEQFSIDTSANIVDAHTAYFQSPVFHKRLGKRLRTAGLLP